MSLITHAAGDVTVMSDRPGRSMSGYALLVRGFVLLIVAVYLGWTSLGRSSGGGLLAILIFYLGVFVWRGLYVLQPNDSAVLQLLGSYIGLEHDAGEVHRAARLAEHYEGSTRAVLKVLGRGALVLVGSLMSLAGWMLTGIVWLWATLLGVVALTRGLARWVWPRRPAQTRSLGSRLLARLGRRVRAFSLNPTL